MANPINSLLNGLRAGVNAFFPQAGQINAMTGAALPTLNPDLKGNVPKLDNDNEPEVNTGDYDKLTTFDVSMNGAVLSFPGMVRYNPDDLVGLKGLGIYAKMMVDEQVKAVTDFKLAAIMARGWELYFDDDCPLSDEEQKARIDQVKCMLGKSATNFNDVIEGIASGFWMGYSITEKVFTNVMVDGKMMNGLNVALVRNPAAFLPIFDPHGTLVQLQQRAGGFVIEVDQDKIIRYTHKPMWDQFYGRSELRAAYKWWYVKDQVTKMWSLYLEKFAGGIAVASRTDDTAPAQGTPEYTKLGNALTSMKANSWIILPRNVTLDIKFPTTTDAYEKCLTFCDLAIAKSQLMPNLMGQSHTGQTGSFSQSKTQFEGYLWVVERDAERLETVLNNQLFEDLGELNYADGNWPRFRFKPASFEHLTWMLNTWNQLLTAGAVVASEEDEVMLRRLLEMPPRAPDEVLQTPEMKQQADALAAKTQQAKQGGDPLQALAASVQQLHDKITAMATPPQPSITINNAAAPSSPEHNQTPPKHHAGRHEHDSVVPHEALRGIPREIFDRAIERVSFSTIEQRTDAMAAHYVPDLAGIIARATKRMLGSDEDLSQLTDSDPSDVAAIDVSAADRGKLKRTFGDMLKQGWTIGGQMAKNEIDRAAAQTQHITARRQSFAALRDNAAAYFETQAFRMAGDASDQTRKLIQQRLQNAIKFGTPLKDVRADIWDALVTKGLTTQQAVRGIETDDAVNNALDLLWLDTLEDVPAYLNTLVRTNTFEALNEARYSEFTDPALSDFVLALRYAAVLDSSTTEICTALNDSIWKTDSTEWDVYRPPNHFNCRSVLVPITAIDGWDGVESPEPSIEPQDGFK